MLRPTTTTTVTSTQQQYYRNGVSSRNTLEALADQGEGSALPGADGLNIKDVFKVFTGYFKLDVDISREGFNWFVSAHEKARETPEVSCFSFTAPSVSSPNTLARSLAYCLSSARRMRRPCSKPQTLFWKTMNGDDEKPVVHHSWKLNL